MRVVSVNLGSVQDIEIRGKKVPTGIFKVPVEGPQWLDVEGLRGDAQVEARKLGDGTKAVHAYPYEHYAHWEEHLGRGVLPLGQFGENLTVTGLLETEVRVGDVFRIGTALLQLAHPRIPCQKLDARLGEGFKRIFLERRRVGYYLRVLQPGLVAAGNPIKLVETDLGSPTLDEFVRVSQFDYWDVSGLEHLLRARALSSRWRAILEDKLFRARNAEGWFGPRALEVIQRIEESDTAASFYLRCARAHPLPPFRAGQDLTLSIRPDPHGRAHRRAAALSSDPAKTSCYRVTVGFENAPSAGDPDFDAVSEFLRRLGPGDVIRATEPQGWFTPESLSTIPCDKVFFVSEGIGIASIVSMLHSWSRHLPRIPAVFLHTNSRGGFDLMKSEAAAIRSATGILETIEGESFRELRASGLGERPLVFAAGHSRFMSEVQEDCFALGLDHSRVRVKRLAERVSSLSEPAGGARQ